MKLVMIKEIISFLKENKKELKEAALGFGSYIVNLEAEEFALNRDISPMTSTEGKVLLPILKEKDWDIFLQKVEEEITSKIIDKTQIKVVDNKYLEKLLGMSEEQASEKIKSDGFIHRTVKRDGEDFLVTQDIREDRVNLTISNNKVIEAHRG
ncbi:MAG: hypothetical protein ACRCX2_36515 [Paraclostridium sp.]